GVAGLRGHALDVNPDRGRLLRVEARRPRHRFDGPGSCRDEVSPRIVLNEPRRDLLWRHTLELHPPHERVDTLDEEPAILRHGLPHDADVPVVKLLHEVPHAFVDAVVVWSLAGPELRDLPDVRDDFVSIWFVGHAPTDGSSGA